MREVVQDRLPMISQFGDGLKACNVHEAIQNYPEELKNLFCIETISQELTEDQFVDLFYVAYSEQQQKKLKEINTFKVFSDFVAMVTHGGMFVAFNLFEILVYLHNVDG